MYFTVVFIAAPLMIATGPAMSPAVIGRYPWYARIFGGRQAARSLHFLGMAFLALFTVTHIALVFVVHPDHNLPHMILGSNDTTRFAQALTVCLIGIATVVAAWLAISYLSLVDVRRRVGGLECIEHLEQGRLGQAIVWFSFEGSLVGSYEASHGGSSTFRSQAGS